jgi:hypothetical protein
MYEFKPWIPPWWEGSDYMKPDPEIESLVHESYREEVEEIKPLLLEELEQAQAPFTGKATACVLETWEWESTGGSGRFYGGHALEIAPGNFITAAQMATAKIESLTEEITGIYVAGKNLREDKRLKHVMPSPADYDALSERFKEEWGPTIIIVSPDSDEYVSVWASKHAPNYGVKHPSNFAVESGPEGDIEPDILASYIAEATGMKLNDAEFIARLRWFGPRQGMQIYLTGSASGRGEISGAVKVGYTDIDLLVVTDLEKVEAERMIAELAEEHFGPLTHEPMAVNDWQNNRQIDGVFLYDTDGNKKIQLHIGKIMEEINFRPSNLERNFYHRVC